MNRKNNGKITVKRIAIYAYMLIILLTLVTAASYTWFSISQTPRVSDMNMYVNVPEGMKLSLDPLSDDWTLQLDLRDMVDVTTPLRPVTWVNEEKRFYAASYGLDGRLLPFEYWEPLDDQRNANKDTLDGYYIKLSFYAQTDTPVNVFLSPAVEVDEGINGAGTYLIGRPIWDPEKLRHDNGGLGAETAMRLGFLITPVDALGVPTGKDAEFFIYEPNADVHVDGSYEYVNTPSITGEDDLVDGDHLIRQGYSLWIESDPVERDVVVKAFGDFESSPKLFSLKEDAMVKIDLYIWLEGQDRDCVNEIHNAQILASVQFKAEADNQSGLVPIDPDE